VTGSTSALTAFLQAYAADRALKSPAFRQCRAPGQPSLLVIIAFAYILERTDTKANTPDRRCEYNGDCAAELDVLLFGAPLDARELHDDRALELRPEVHPLVARTAAALHDDGTPVLALIREEIRRLAPVSERRVVPLTAASPKQPGG